MRLLPLVSLALLALLLFVMAAPSGAHAQEPQPEVGPPGNLNLVNLKAEAGHQKVTLTWDAASDAEKAKITRYEVQQGTSFSGLGEVAWSAIADSNSETNTHTVTGLTNGTAYYFRIRAAGPGGAGLASPTVSSRPLPEVTNIAITSNPKSGDTYGADEKIEVTATFSEAMTVTGVPFLRLTVGGSVQPADYASGSGSTALVFAYTVTAYDKDADGISIPRNPLIRTSSDPTDSTEVTIRNASGVDAVTNHSGLSDQASHKVDGSLDTTAPTIFELGIFDVVDEDGDLLEEVTYGVGDEISVWVTFSELVVVTGTPTLDVTIGTNTRSFSYVANSLAVFTYTVQAGDTDADGISIAADSLDVPSGASIKDQSGNDAVVTHAALPAQSAHKVSTTIGGL